MASDISQGEQYLWVSNRRLFTLLDFGCEVGAQLASAPSEVEFVGRLKRFGEGAFPGISFELDVVFPTTQERKWWARVFHIVASRVFRRVLGDHEHMGWQPSTIGDAYVIARMLTRAVQEVELAWHPDLEDPVEADAYTSGPINLRS